MKYSLQKGQSFFNSYFGFFILTVIFLWMKTYIAQLTQFDLGIENTMQKFLLFFNPLGSSLLFLSLGFLFKGKRKYTSLIVINSLLTLLLYANILYYRFFNDFVTLPVISQVQNVGSVGSSMGSLYHQTDLLLFADILLLIGLLYFKVIKMDVQDMARRKFVAVLSLALGVSCLNLGLAEADRPQLLTRGFDRNYIVKYLGIYNFTAYDTVQTMKASAQRVTADSSDITEVVNFTQSNYAEPNPAYFGVGKGMNVIYLHLESMQEFPD